MILSCLVGAVLYTLAGLLLAARPRWRRLDGVLYWSAHLWCWTWAVAFLVAAIGFANLSNLG